MEPAERLLVSIRPLLTLDGASYTLTMAGQADHHTQIQFSKVNTKSMGYFKTKSFIWSCYSVSMGPLSRGGDVAVYVFDINQPSLPTPFYYVLVSVSVFVALSTVVHSINSSNNSPLSHSVLSGLFCFIGPFNYISLYESLPQPGCHPLWLTGLTAPTN